MNKRYRLIKDSPTAKAGTIYFLFIPGVYKTEDSILGTECLPYKVVENSPEWFEEVKEWVPKLNDLYYYINGFLQINATKNTDTVADNEYIEVKNCFKSREQAEKIREEILQILFKNNL